MFCFVVVVFGFWFPIITDNTDKRTLVRCVLTYQTLDPYSSVTLFSTTRLSPCMLLRISLCIEIAGITRVSIVSTMTTQTHL